MTFSKLVLFFLFGFLLLGTWDYLLVNHTVSSSTNTVFATTGMGPAFMSSICPRFQCQIKYWRGLKLLGGYLHTRNNSKWHHKYQLWSQHADSFAKNNLAPLKEKLKAGVETFLLNCRFD